MGMFDTMHFPEPVGCPTCGAAIASTQTKHIGNLMFHYRVGSVLDCSPVLIGIMEETVWCDHCRAQDQPDDWRVYLVVWHGILGGICRSKEEAEERLRSVDRADLIEWLVRSSDRTRAWQRSFLGLSGDLHRFSSLEKNPDEGDNPIARWHRPDEEILGAEDPLQKILGRNPPPESEQDTGLF